MKKILLTLLVIFAFVFVFDSCAPRASKAPSFKKLIRSTEPYISDVRQNGCPLIWVFPLRVTPSLYFPSVRVIKYQGEYYISPGTDAVYVNFRDAHRMLDWLESVHNKFVDIEEKAEAVGVLEMRKEISVPGTDCLVEFFDKGSGLGKYQLKVEDAVMHLDLTQGVSNSKMYVDYSSETWNSAKMIGMKRDSYQKTVEILQEMDYIKKTFDEKMNEKKLKEDFINSIN